MVLGIATGLLGLGLALPTGLAFGYGYGYGVRQGYSAFKQPSTPVQTLKQSVDPVQGSLGMGLQTAEERTKQAVVPPPTPRSTPIPLKTPTAIQPNLPTETNKQPLKVGKAVNPRLYFTNKNGEIMKKSDTRKWSHAYFKKWMAGKVGNRYSRTR